MNNNNIQVNTNNSGAMGMILGQNEVQEATIVSNGYSGQFGGAAGASVNYLTKSGGNDFHGNAAYYWNGSALNANDWIDNATQIRAPSISPISGRGRWVARLKRINCSSFLTPRACASYSRSAMQVVLPSAKFESATMANIDSIFGLCRRPTSFTSRYSIYTTVRQERVRRLPATLMLEDLGCNGWQGPQGLGTTEACAVHFLKNVDAPSSESIVSGRVDWNIGD